jgi:CheY-like chemotaxis protein
MHSSELSQSCVLRAEIRSPEAAIVACARDLTRQGALIVTDWAPALETRVLVRFSLPGAVAQTEIAARVVERCAGRGVGEPAGVRLAFEGTPSDARDEIAALVQQFRQLRGGGRRSAAAPSEYRVLLVEDSPFIRDLFAYGVGKFFGRHEGRLHFDDAADAASAWSKLLADRYDLLIVDYYLPAEDGASFIARVRQDDRFSTTPVVAVSVGGRQAREATMAAGADIFLDKPLMIRELFNTLRLLAAAGALA